VGVSRRKGDMGPGQVWAEGVRECLHYNNPSPCSAQPIVRAWVWWDLPAGPNFKQGAVPKVVCHQGLILKKL
jgi:hypothetical protein